MTYVPGLTKPSFVEHFVPEPRPVQVAAATVDQRGDTETGMGNNAVLQTLESQTGALLALITTSRSAAFALRMQGSF